MSLFQQLQTLKQAQPNLRNVDAAKQLNISEAQLIHCQIGHGVTQINLNELATLLKYLKRLGEVMALSRNDSVVSEITGTYEKLYVTESEGKLSAIAINPGGIDLRLFLSKWYCAFVVETQTHWSLQFFDKQGKAVHKIFSTNNTDLNEALNLRERFKTTEQTSINLNSVTQNLKKSTVLNDIQREAFQNAWRDLNDVHHFPALIEEFKLSRIEACEQADLPWSREIAANSLESVLSAVRESHSEIMVFVGNNGIVQIYSGKVNTLKQVGPWFNVLDDKFNLHVNTPSIKRAFVVRKPTDNGQTIVTSIEFFDAQNETVLTLFGRRIEGKVQSQEWQAICEALPTLTSTETI
ncbi:Hemin transport protein HmuS [Pseudoalteromonas luteoviolacea B = ATCC 29581]|nr:Hemin transport protein HmuS [Pseudoalteromonas luteoviolacea B = ATCC 29581]